MRTERPNRRAAGNGDLHDGVDAGVALFIGIAALGAFATLITGDWRTFAKPSSS